MSTDKILSLVFTLFPLIMIYLIFYFSQQMSINKNFYGVNLSKEYQIHEEFKALDKLYKKLISIGFIVVLFIYLYMTFMLNNISYGSLYSMLGFAFYQIVSYVWINKKVKLLKNDLVTSSNISSKDINLRIDTKFINEKNKLINKYKILNMIPIIIVCTVSIYAMSKYNELPSMIATHWGPSGDADRFIEKSLINVASTLMMFIFVLAIVYVASIHSLKSRTTFNNTESLKYLTKFANVYLTLNIATSTIMTMSIFSIINSTGINVYIMWTLTLLIIGCSIYMTILWNKSLIKDKGDISSVEDEDSLWILGMFYNNKNDPSMFVAKRYGVGWTVNIGNIKGILFLIVPIIISISAIIFM